MSYVRLGNPNPQEEYLNQSVTRIELWDGIDDPEFIDLTLSTENDRVLSMIGRSLKEEHRNYSVAIAELEQIMGVHSAGEAPTWVESDDPVLAEAVGSYFNCHVGEPLNILTTVGRDALHSQHMNTAAQPASFNYMALTANSTAVSAASTTLTAEIATGGGGLVRAQATYAHTGSATTTTLTKTFTANGSDSLSVTIAKIGIFNASSVGTLGYETLLSSTATLTVSGDNITVTWTGTLS